MVNVHVHKAIYRKESKGTELSFLARTYVYIITSNCIQNTTPRGWRWAVKTPCFSSL